MRIPCGSWSQVLVLAALVTACSPGIEPIKLGTKDAGNQPLPSDGGTWNTDAGTCQDGNACTAERVDEFGRCIYPPAQDGTACSDSNACTTDDQCMNGICVGTPVPSPPETYNTVWSYGVEPSESRRPPLEGLAEFVSNDRLLFGERLDSDGLSLSLVRISSGELYTLDQHVLDIFIEHYFGSWDWSDRFVTFFVPLGPNRVVVVGTRQRLELLGLDGDRITSLSKYPLPPASDSILAGVGRGDDFWTCSSYYVTAWHVGPDHTLSADVLQSISLPAPCRSLTLSEDGNTLWAATQRGLVPVDLSGSIPVVQQQIFPQQAFFHVRSQGAYVVAQELVPYGGLGRILVFHAQDMKGSIELPVPVKEFHPRRELARWELPIGFALNDLGLLLEWFRYQGSTRTYVAETHALTGAGVSDVLGSLTLRESDEVGLLLSPLSLSGSGRHAVLQPWRRVIEVDDWGVPRFVTGEGHGSLERLWVNENGTVTATGPFGSHRVVVTLEGNLSLIGGGLTLPPGTNRLRLLASNPEESAWELMTVPADSANVTQEEGIALVSCLRRSSTGIMELNGKVRLDGGPAALASARGRLYQVAPRSGDTWQVRRFAIPSNCSGTLLAPENELLLRGAIADSTPRSGWGFAADAERSELLLSEVYYHGPSTPSRMPITWFSGETLDSAVRSELSGSTDQVTALALARGRALVIENRRMVYVLERDGDRIYIRAHVDMSASTSPIDVSQILSFDGEVAWLAVSSRPMGVVALRVADLSVLARYRTPSLVRSLAFAEGRLMLGMSNGLMAAEPMCAAAR